MGLKMPLCKWHNFCPMFNNGPMFNLLFYCHIILYWEKVSFHKKFSHNISKLSGKFQRFNTIDESIEIQKNIWISKISIKLKKYKIFYETQTASRFSASRQVPPDKILLRHWNKKFLREIYRNIKTFAFK